MNVLYLLTTATQIQTVQILMDLFCVLVIVDSKETKLFVKVNDNVLIKVEIGLDSSEVDAWIIKIRIPIQDVSILIPVLFNPLQSI
jgi:hypothetical protein